jgi:hypothetical protein
MTRMATSFAVGALGRLRRRLLDERAYSVVELIIMCAILGIVLGGITAVVVSGSKAELELNQRFQAQLNARLALDKIRREAHCASALSPVGPGASITLTLPAGCPTGMGDVSWCALFVSTNRYALYREPGATCSTGGVLQADYLTIANVFNYTGQSALSLAKLRVDFPVNVYPDKAHLRYELIDDIVLRNTLRT